MFFSEITDRGPTPALVHSLAFTQARLDVIAENIANQQTPGYRAKQLDTAEFQGALRESVEVRERNPRAAFAVRGREVQTRTDGSLQVTPSELPVEQVLFHDGTNVSLERQMAELAETGLAHELAVTLLNGRMDSLRRVIRETV